jgi:hypothetical protein
MDSSLIIKDTSVSSYHCGPGCQHLRTTIPWYPHIVLQTESAQLAESLPYVPQTRFSSNVDTLASNTELFEIQQGTAFSPTELFPSNQDSAALPDPDHPVGSEPSQRTPERRKVQNRISQRAYRERQRNRLAELEKRLAECTKVIGWLKTCNAQLEKNYHDSQTESTRLKKENESIKDFAYLLKVESGQSS